jgi:histidine kinase/DNA gyrase B/HSP90-like ATPase
LYHSPAACIKELVNNSYDADATKVQVFVKPDANRIIVSDDGIGMSHAEFVEHFDHVSESHKRDGSDKTPSGRPKVGKIGIGFIAANELCNKMEIVSTKSGSKDLLKVEIDFGATRLDIDERRAKGDEIVKADYAGVVEAAGRDEHYTHVLLKDIRPNLQEILVAARLREFTSGKLSVYGMAPESVRDLIASDEITDWGKLDEYSQMVLQVGLNVPVRYLPDWYPPKHSKILRPLEQEVEKLGFSVFADGSDLRKPVVLDAGEGNLLRALSIDGDHVGAKGYFFAKRRALRPQWLNGVLIRIRNAAVGEYDATFLGFKSSEQTLFQRWTSSEIWADDDLEDALNIDRRTLRVTHPAYIELQEAYHDMLSDFLREARRVLHGAPAAERKREKARREVERFPDAIERTELPARARKEIRAAVQRRAPRAGSAYASSDVRTVLHKYSVAELYEVVLEVARTSLPAADYERFARALAKRLLD